MPIIKLRSSDDELIETELQFVKSSGKIMAFLGPKIKEDVVVVPLPNVSSKILSKVLLWTEYHKDDDPLPVEDADGRKHYTITPWDVDFLNVDQSTLLETFMASYDLDIKGLKNQICHTLANMLKGKTPAQVRQTFNIREE